MAIWLRNYLLPACFFPIDTESGVRVSNCHCHACGGLTTGRCTLPWQ